MTDNLTPAQRSKRMSLGRSKHTGPEMLVRRLVHGMGYRYRLHGKKLPGRPDLVFASRHRVIFVHGARRGKPAEATRFRVEKLGHLGMSAQKAISASAPSLRIVNTRNWNTILECRRRTSTYQLTRPVADIAKAVRQAAIKEVGFTG